MSTQSEIYAAANGHIEVVQVTDENIRQLEEWSTQLRYHEATKSLELKLRRSQRFANGPDSVFISPGEYIGRQETGMIDLITPFELSRHFRKLEPQELADKLIVLEAERKPNLIKAVRFYIGNGEELARWCGGTLGWVRFRDSRELTIMLRDSDNQPTGDVHLGEYVVQEADGTFRRCSEEEFNSEYNVLNNQEN